MNERNTNSGWNRPKDAGGGQVTERKSSPLWLRGAVAGLCVAVLAGAAAWFLVGRGSENAAGDQPLGRSSIDTVKPASGKRTQSSAQIASVEPSLPIPKISNERVESRVDIPAPQPLAEMEAAMTNRPPKKKRAFNNAAEQLIALATPSTPGATVPPLPDITDEGIANDVEKAMKNIIRPEEGDSVSLLEKKAIVAEAKEEFRELRDNEGWGFAEYVKALRDKANEDADFLTEAHNMADEIYHDKNISDEDYVKYRDQINAKLRERGLPEIDSEDEKSEGETKNE